jgi:hypothetical protein
MAEDDATKLAGLQAHGNAIEIFGLQTGHSVRAIAFCDSPEMAVRIVAAVKLAARISFGSDGVIG